MERVSRRGMPQGRNLIRDTHGTGPGFVRCVQGSQPRAVGKALQHHTLPRGPGDGTRRQG